MVCAPATKKRMKTQMSILRMLARRSLGVGGSILLIGTIVWARADEPLPKRLDFDRYKGMLEHSPFAIATAVVAPAATPNFAKDLYVANAAKAEGCDTATIASTTDKEFKKYLTTCGGPVDGYAIANIEWSDKVGETRVTISKDGQFATLSFNQAEMASKPIPNRPPAAPGMPPTQLPAPGVQRSPQMPTPVTPAATPHVRGVIPRNPQQQQQQQQQIQQQLIQQYATTPVPTLPPRKQPDQSED